MRPFSLKISIFGYLSFFVLALSLSASSIDQIFDELMRDPAFQSADREMSQVYGFVRSKMDADKQSTLRDLQRKWIASRDSAILSAPPQTRLATALAQTRSRIESLKNYQVALKSMGTPATSQGNLSPSKPDSFNQERSRINVVTAKEVVKENAIKEPSNTRNFREVLNLRISEILSRETNLGDFVDKNDDAIDSYKISTVKQKQAELSKIISRYGPGSLQAGAAYSDLADALKLNFQLRDAELALKKALDIVFRKQGPDHINYAFTLNAFANLYTWPSVMNYEDAITLRMGAVDILDRARDFTNAITIRQDLGHDYLIINDQLSASSQFKAAYSSLKRIKKTNEGMVCLVGLGRCHMMDGELSAAENYFRQALNCTGNFEQNEPESLEAEKRCAEDYLAQCLVLMGRADEARLLNDKHVVDCREWFRDTSSSGARECLAALLETSGKIANAQQRSTDAFENFRQSYKLWTSVNHKNNLITLGIEDSLIRSAILNQDINFALSLTSSWETSVSENMRRITTCGNETQRLNFIDRYTKFDIPAAIFTARQLADSVVRWKGYVVDSVLADQKMNTSASSAAEKGKLIQLRRLKGELMSLEISLSTRVSNSLWARKSELEAKIAEYESELFTRVRGSGRVPSVRTLNALSVQQILLPNTCVVEFFDYFPVSCTSGSGERMCCAVIIPPEGEPERVDFGEISGIENLVKQYNDLIISSENQDSKVLSMSRELYSKLLRPIFSKLDNKISKIILSPTGRINFLSFATLIDDSDQFSGKSFSFSYISSSRDLLAPGSDSVSKTLTLLSDPLFSSQSSGVTTDEGGARGSGGDGTEKILFRRLIGTKREAGEVLSIAKNSGWETVNYSGSDATKQRVTGVASPTILHLATHGFFFDPENATDGLGQSRGLFVKAVEDSSGLGNSGVAELSLRAFKNSPMRQGGIALANAQNTVEAWARGQVVNSENNGVLTAEEIALLDLNKTWIVVLSACQTGVGKARSGEGVFGLRRAFMIAGAENLVMTLWPVADEATASIVADFYSKALSTGNAWESLAEVQRDWLVKLRKEKGLQIAVRDAGPFAMAVMVNPAKRKSGFEAK